VSSLLDRAKTFLPTGSFRRNVTLVASGAVLGQALVVLASPLLTRFFSPEEFGVLAVYMAALSVLLIFSSLRYELAIPLPQSDIDAVNLLAISVAIVPVVSALTWLGTAAFGRQLVELLKAPMLARFLWLLPVGVLVAGIHQSLTYWATRKGQFGTVSYARIFQSAGQVGIQIPVGAAGAGPGGLISGVLAGRILATAALLRRSEIPLRQVRPSIWRRTAWEHRHFALYSTWASLLTTAGTAATPIMFAVFFPLHVVGVISLDVRILGLPAAVVGLAVTQVFYPRVARLHDDTVITRKFVLRVATGLLLLAVPMFMFIGVAGPTVFSYVFGDKWHDAGIFARCLVPWLALNFVASPLTTFSLVKKRQRTAFLFTIYETALRFAGIWVGGHVHSALLAASLYSAAGFLISGVYLAWILRLSGATLRAWLAPLTHYLVATVVCLLLLIALSAVLSGMPLVLAATMVSLSLGTWGLARHRGVFSLSG
jgi:lipopolysaccharide exporter